MITRRSLLLSLLAAPAIVRAASLMKLSHVTWRDPDPGIQPIPYKSASEVMAQLRAWLDRAEVEIAQSVDLAPYWVKLRLSCESGFASRLKVDA